MTSAFMSTRPRGADSAPRSGCADFSFIEPQPGAPAPSYASQAKIGRVWLRGYTDSFSGAPEVYAIDIPKRKAMRALFCAAHLILNTLVDEFGALVEW